MTIMPNSLSKFWSMRKYVAFVITFLLLGTLLACGKMDNNGVVQLSSASVEKLSEVTLDGVKFVRTEDGAVVQIGGKEEIFRVLFEDDANLILGTSKLIWVRGNDVSVIDPPARTSEVFEIVPWVLNHDLYAFMYEPSPETQELLGAVYRYGDKGWHKLYDLAPPCDFSYAVVHDGDVYFYGGRAGVFRLDDGRLIDIGNLDHSSGVVFSGEKMFVLAGLTSPTVYSYDLSNEKMSEVRVFKNTHDISWVGICGFPYMGKLPVFLLEKYVNGEFFLYAYDAASDKLIPAGQVEEDVAWYSCLYKGSDVYLFGDDIYRVSLKK